MASQHLRGFVFLLTSNDVLASREQRQQLGRYRAANETEQTDGRNGKPNGKQWIGNITANQPLRDVVEEEYVHQIHAKRQFGKAINPSWSLADAGEQQERSKGGECHVGRAEFPRPFQHRRFHHLPWHTFPPETPCRESRTDDEADASHSQPFFLRPINMNSYEVRQHQIA